MKTYWAIGLSVVAAVGGIVIFTLVQYGLVGAADPLAIDIASTSRANASAGQVANGQSPAAAAVPIAVVDKPVFHFGRVRNHTKGHRHEFLVRNEGNAPLQFNLTDVSCTKCTYVDLPDREIAPGKTGRVVVRWDIEKLEETFRQSATVYTNDPKHEKLQFVVTGDILEPLRAAPQDVRLTGVASADRTTASVLLSAYFADDLKIERHEFLKADTADSFEVAYSPVAKDELAHLALSGVEARITIKPGLPLGAFRQTIRFVTNLKEAPHIEVNVSGLVVSDITVAGPNWDPGRGTLKLGAVNRESGAKRTLRLMVKGPHQEGLVLKVKKRKPSLLKATIGNFQRVNNGKTTLIPIEIEVPAKSRPVNFMGGDAKLGEIFISTNKPEFGDIKLLVQFAVEG